MKPGNGANHLTLKNFPDGKFFLGFSTKVRSQMGAGRTYVLHPFLFGCRCRNSPIVRCDI